MTPAPLCFAIRCQSAQFADPEHEAAFGRQRHGAGEARRFLAEVFGTEAAQEHGESERVFDLAHGAADAGALAATERKIGILHLTLGAAHPAFGAELFRLRPEFRIMVRAVGKHHHAIAGFDLLAANDVVLGGDADETPDRGRSASSPG